ncbi:hypothetical protein M433DRAFT_142029 [Acidomyces richmondensis BFW]|nr:MAG: hypothetical protein FE78DRAFT_77234 [Acidomyces sp. 'richmondensis']KYG47414.1 hypothetical protein M433DRAFT_142029 [Acidomyces richmondensis BFW]
MGVSRACFWHFPVRQSSTSTVGWNVSSAFAFWMTHVASTTGRDYNFHESGNYAITRTRLHVPLQYRRNSPNGNFFSGILKNLHPQYSPNSPARLDVATK